MNNFNYVQYIEGKRAEKGVTQAKMAEIIGCSGSNYANKVSRESFDFKEIANICNFLGINLNSLKVAMDVDDSRISEAIEDLKYGGNNNYYRNEKGFAVAESILDNEVILSVLDKNIKFEIGYLMVSVAPNHNDFGIRQADTFFNRLLGLREKIDKDFLAGMLYGSFYEMNQKSILYLYPKYLYFPKLLEYILNTYNENSIIYIFNEIDGRTQLSASTYIFIPEVYEIIRRYLGDDFREGNSYEGVDILEKVIKEIFNGKVKNKLVEYELNKFLLKINYIKRIHFNI